MRVVAIGCVLVVLAGAAWASGAAAWVVASVAMVRAEPREGGAVAGRLKIATKVTVLERRDGWTRVRAGKATGWVRDDGLDSEKPTVEAMRERFDATPPSDVAGRRKWIERAAALAPGDAEVLGLLEETLARTGDADALSAARIALRDLLAPSDWDGPVWVGQRVTCTGEERTFSEFLVMSEGFHLAPDASPGEFGRASAALHEAQCVDGRVFVPLRGNWAVTGSFVGGGVSPTLREVPLERCATQGQKESCRQGVATEEDDGCAAKCEEAEVRGVGTVQLRSATQAEYIDATKTVVSAGEQLRVVVDGKPGPWHDDSEGFASGGHDRGHVSSGIAAIWVRPGDDVRWLVTRSAFCDDAFDARVFRYSGGSTTKGRLFSKRATTRNEICEQ